MKIRYYHAKIMPFVSGDLKIIEGEVWTQDDQITFVGLPEERKPDQVWNQQIDCGGNLLIPGFKNAHTHSGMTFLRSYADDKPLQAWLQEDVIPHEEKLSEEDVYWFTALALLEYISSGITSNFDMYYFPQAAAQAAIDMGYRTVLCGSLSGFNGVSRPIAYDYEKFQNYHPLISYILGFHAEYSTPMKCMQELAEVANAKKAPIYAHNSETQREVTECITRWGKTPTVLMRDLGLFNYGGGGFHCVHFSEADQQIFREYGLYAVTNPMSNLKLSSGIAPIKDFLDRGIHVAIGTDGPASNNALDMFREMLLMVGLQKLKYGKADAIAAAEALKSACYTGAHAMSLPDCDSLAPGKQADMVLLDLLCPNMQPIHDIAKNIVYSGSKDNIKMTVIAGKILWKDGNFIGLDANLIYKSAQRLTNQLLSR